ncbi:MAG: sugar nucleotide-binding protein, partial [Patescibacteria group bacterium]
MAKIGVLGPKGRVGSFLVANGCIPVDVNIANKKELEIASLDDYDVVINCAAITDVDSCQHPEGKTTQDYLNAVMVNSRALDYIRSSFSGRLIHISTDYVFKGDKGPYIENDKRDPVNDYGWTKLGGEINLETYPEDLETVIVRTTGLYGSERDFGYYVWSRLNGGYDVPASKELCGNQTYIPHFCEALMFLAHVEEME